MYKYKKKIKAYMLINQDDGNVFTFCVLDKSFLNIT